MLNNMESLNNLKMTHIVDKINLVIDPMYSQGQVSFKICSRALYEKIAKLIWNNIGKDIKGNISNEINNFRYTI